MTVSYNKLWEWLIDKKLNKTQLEKNAKISTNGISKLGTNKKVSLDTLEEICVAVGCNLGDIVEVVDRDEV